MGEIARILGRALHAPEKWLYRAGLLDRGRLTLPDFLCIGAQKGGTSWLFTNLAAHPDVFVPPGPEHFDLHYFDREFHRSPRYYSRCFEPGEGKVKGENTPAYGLLAPDRIRFIRTLMPDLKILFMMRNPVERAWSHALMNLVKERGRRFEDVGREEFLSHFEMPRVRMRSDYASILDRWKAVYPEDRFHIAYFEQIRTGPRDLLLDVFRFLGLSVELDWETLPFAEHVNRGPGVPIPEEFRRRLEAIYRDEIEELHRRFGAPVEAWRIG